MEEGWSEQFIKGQFGDASTEVTPGHNGNAKRRVSVKDVIDSAKAAEESAEDATTQQLSSAARVSAIHMKI